MARKRTHTSDSPRTITKLPKLPARDRDAHKGTFGRVLVIGGSRGMIGAPSLTANAALRSGAGLVTIAIPESIYQSVATLCPCATTIPLPETPNGQLDPKRALKAIDESRMLGAEAKPDVVAAGPGLGRGIERFDKAWRDLLHAFSLERDVPVVLDADGLNAMPTIDPESVASSAYDWSNMVLTPHPGEFARLCNMKVADVQSQRKQIVANAARRLNTDRSSRACTILLKGAGTLVCDGEQLFTNKTGNPGMATGGSGDVLTGIIAALVGQGMSLFDAASLGAHLHGKAGDLAAGELSAAGLIASDLIAFLPRAF